MRLPTHGSSVPLRPLVQGRDTSEFRAHSAVEFWRFANLRSERETCQGMFFGAIAFISSSLRAR